MNPEALVTLALVTWFFVLEPFKMFFIGQGQQLRGATPCPGNGGCAGTGGPRGATPRSRSGGAAVRRCPVTKVGSSGCALLQQL